jgi:hypothetical protein
MIHGNIIFDRFIDHDSINKGGCGLYALVVARYLTRQYSFTDFELVICSWNSYQLEEIKDNNNIINNVPSHVVLKVDDWCIDAVDGIIHIDVFKNLWEERRKIIDFIDFDEFAMITALNEPMSWNETFNRSWYIPMFEDHFNVCLKDILIEV